MFLRPNDDDTCDTPESLSPELIDLLRSGNPPEAEDHQYARGVVEQLDGKISEYGQAITDLHAQIRIVEGKKASLERKRAHFRALISPIRRIPPEILSYILLSLQRRFVGNSFWGTGARFHDSPTLDFSQVCVYWRRVVRSTPQLWAVMHVSADKDHPGVGYIFNHHLEHAKDAPFHLTLDIGGTKAAKSACMLLLIQRRHLWRTLRLIGEYRHVIPFIEGLERLPQEFTVQKLDIDSKNHAGRPPDVATHDYLEEILQFIQTKCPDLRCLSLNIPTWSGRRPIPHSFLCQLTSIDLSLPIDIMLNIVIYNKNTLISARLTVHRNLYRDYIDSEMGAIDAVHHLGKVSLPCIQNLTVSVMYSIISTSISHRHAAALLESISETPLLQRLVFQGNADYPRLSRCDERLELFASILAFIHRSCTNLYALELDELPLDDVEAIQLLQGVSRLKHLVVRAHDSSRSFTTLSSELMKSMTLTKSAEGDVSVDLRIPTTNMVLSEAELVPNLKYLSLEFGYSSSSILPDGRDISEVSDMLQSRVGTLLSGSLIFQGILSTEELEALSMPGIALRIRDRWKWNHKKLEYEDRN